MIIIMTIPIIIICYNNYKYVRNTVKQLIDINKELYQHIIILDNKSTCNNTVKYLRECNIKVIYNESNNGPWINPYTNVDIYNSLPDKFIITDPDLEFNKDMPSNFIDTLINLSDKYNTYKIGFALDISDFDKMYQNIYCLDRNIYDWEKQFWKNKVDDKDYELYYADIDTTFCLFNKNSIGSQIRIAGNYTAKHIPWYKNNKIYNTYELYDFCNQTTLISTISKLIKPYLDNEYIKINKNNNYLFIKNEEDPNFNFWKNIYSDWEVETFQVFDKYLDINKVFIDIGAWIGTTCIYAEQKSKHVYAIDGDIESFKSLEINCKNNCNNYTLINKAIFNIDNSDIKFGKNLYLNNSKLNDSTSHIYIDDTHSEQCYITKTITINSLIEQYNINYNDISLIKVDIEGGEEYILSDLYELYNKYKIPLYISFHYSWWKDMNLNRFVFLSEEQKNNIRNYPFTSLLFVN